MYDRKLTSHTSRMCFQIVGMHSFSLPFEINIYHILQSVSGKLDIDSKSKINRAHKDGEADSAILRADKASLGRLW
jgi:hypothetical protein